MEKVLPPFKTAWSHLPLSRSILIAGLPFLPEEFLDKGLTIRCVRWWQEPQWPSPNIDYTVPLATFVRLQPPPMEVYRIRYPNIPDDGLSFFTSYQPNLKLIWGGEFQGYPYLILEAAPRDPDDELFTHHVVRLLPNRKVLPLNFSDLIQIEPHLRLAVEDQPAPARDCLNNILGIAAIKGSDPYYQQCLKERNCTAKINFWQIELNAGVTIPIVDVSSEDRQLIVLLALSLSSNDRFAYYVKACWTVDRESYLLLQSISQTIMEDEAPLTRIVAYSINGLRVLSSDDEFNIAARALIDNLEQYQRFRPLILTTQESIKVMQMLNTAKSNAIVASIDY